MLYYSTLKEAYNIDTFERDKKYKKKKAKCDEELMEESEEIKQPMASTSIEPQSTICTKTQKPTVSMKNVKPFLDEELEQYLNVEDFKNAIPEPNLASPASAAPVAFVEPVTSVTSVTSATPVSVTPVVPVTTPPAPVANKDDKDLFYRNLINIGLFAFIGILIIFLCDQITEIAINLGMKKTVAILEPYLRKP
jgi:hypothetical protein